MRCIVKIVCLSIICSSCVYDPPDSRLEIINKSGNSCFIITKVDTILSMSGYGVPYFSKNEVLPGDTLELFESGPNGWHIIFNEIKKNKLYLFVFNQDSIKKYGSIEELAKRKQYDMVEYTEKQLEDLDWKVKINNHE